MISNDQLHQMIMKSSALNMLKLARSCNKSNAMIRTDECKTFCIYKNWFKSVQFKPKEYANVNTTRNLEQGDSFKCLGRWFDVEMENQKHKDELLLIPI